MKRAKIAFALAFSFSVLANLQPVKAATLLDAVNDILGLPLNVAGAVIDTTTDVTTGTVILPGTQELVLVQPAVIATSLSVPSDVPNRFNELNTRIDDWFTAGRIGAAERNELKCALGSIESATATMAADGLSYKESRKIYRAMDKVGGEVNLRSLNENDRNDFVGLRTTGNLM